MPRLAKMAAFNFGSTVPSFGSGSATTVAAPAFSGFGPTSSTGSTGFSFGTSAAPSAGFGGFGSNPTTTATGFGFGGLGSGLNTMTTTTGPSLFSGFGSTTTTTTSAPTFTFSSLGQLGSTTASSYTGAGLSGGGSLFPSSGGFGSNLGTFGTGSLGSNTFGQNTYGTSGGLPSFGATTFGAGASSGSGAFGSNLGFSSFGQGSAQAASTQALTNLATALSCPLVFCDERDVILAKWNKLQSYWGMGKGFFSSNGQFAEFTPDNPFCRFKAIGYSCIPTAKNEDGFVALTVNKSSTDLIVQQQQLVDSLHRILGSRPTLSVCVEGVKPAPDNRTEVIIYILERAPTGASRRIPASEVYSYLMQPNIKMQLANLSVEGIIAKSAPTKEQLEQYLKNPPAGIDPLLWQQAKLDNPDPENLFPVPMIGFKELQQRLVCQEQETKQHQVRLNLIAEDIAELQRSNANSKARIAELKRKQLDLGHRVLKVMVKQETSRKLGFAIQGDEEQLRVQLEALQAELSAPTQFKGRLNELISQIRMQNHQTLVRADERYNVDSNLQEDMKQVLKQQQEGISHLINVIRNDLEDLKLIEQEQKNVHHR